jgi:cytochrome c6
VNRLPIVSLWLAIAGLFPAAAAAAPGSQIWAGAGCGSCHTLAAAGSTGQVGPNLDQLRPSASRIALQITNGGAAMPSFSGSLSATDIQSLATWVASVSGAGAGSSSTGSGTTGGSSSSAPSGSAATKASGPGGALTGMDVAAVRRLQTDLARLGYFHHVVTGYYGLVTTAAVKTFQRSAGLKPDGIWGQHSEGALKKRLAGA